MLFVGTTKKLFCVHYCQCYALAAELRRRNADFRRKKISFFFCVFLRQFCDILRSVRSTDITCIRLGTDEKTNKVPRRLDFFKFSMFYPF